MTTNETREQFEKQELKMMDMIARLEAQRDEYKQALTAATTQFVMTAKTEHDTARKCLELCEKEMKEAKEDADRLDEMFEHGIVQGVHGCISIIKSEFGLGE